MIKATLAQINEWIPNSNVTKEEKTEIHGVSTDTRTIQKGNLFIPLIGENFNGHKFVEQAYEEGAIAALWQRDQTPQPEGVPLVLVDDTLQALQTLSHNYRKSLSIQVVGITGSNGKTTTKDMIAAVASTKYKVLKTRGNLNNHIGLPLTMLELDETIEVAILEMGMSDFGEIDLLSKLGEPDIAVITNIGEAHIQNLGSREGIAKAKFEIVNGLNNNGVFIYEGEEPLLAKLSEGVSFEKHTFGYNKNCDLRPLNVTQTESGTVFSLSTDESVTCHLPVLGKHNVKNALASILVGKALGISAEEAVKGLSQLQLTKMRMEVIETSNGARLINDAYNASPTAMRAALHLLHELSGYNRKIAVLGDMLELGEDEREYHYEVGKSIDKNEVSYVFAYGPLSEEVAKGASDAGVEHVYHFEDKDTLSEQLSCIIKEQDVILFKASRGMKLEQVITALLEKGI